MVFVASGHSRGDSSLSQRRRELQMMYLSLLLEYRLPIKQIKWWLCSGPTRCRRPHRFQRKPSRWPHSTPITKNWFKRWPRYSNISTTKTAVPLTKEKSSAKGKPPPLISTSNDVITNEWNISRVVSTKHWKLLSSTKEDFLTDELHDSDEASLFLEFSHRMWIWSFRISELWITFYVKIRN